MSSMPTMPGVNAAARIHSISTSPASRPSASRNDGDMAVSPAEPRVSWPCLRPQGSCSDGHPVGLGEGRKEAGGIAEGLAKNAGGGEKEAYNAISLLAPAPRWRCLSLGTKVSPRAPRPE